MKTNALRLLCLVPLLMLASCVLSPGKFVSTLHIGKDRSFTFTYAGEVILLDPANSMGKGLAEAGSGGMAEDEDAADPAPALPAKDAAETADSLATGKAVAEALSKEVGYRSVEYLGRQKFRVDYAMSGRLDRSFVYPINLDAKAVIPWIVVEPRTDNTVRVKAIAFGDPDEGMGSIAKPESKEQTRSGTFTFTTDAELVMHNNEAGKAPGPGTKVIWNVTAASRTVPTAVVRF